MPPSAHPGAPAGSATNPEKAAGSTETGGPAGAPPEAWAAVGFLCRADAERAYAMNIPSPDDWQYHSSLPKVIGPTTPLPPPSTPQITMEEWQQRIADELAVRRRSDVGSGGPDTGGGSPAGPAAAAGGGQSGAHRLRPLPEPWAVRRGTCPAAFWTQFWPRPAKKRYQPTTRSCATCSQSCRRVVVSCYFLGLVASSSRRWLTRPPAPSTTVLSSFALGRPGGFAELARAFIEVGAARNPGQHNLQIVPAGGQQPLGDGCRTGPTVHPNRGDGSRRRPRDTIVLICPSGVTPREPAAERHWKPRNRPIRWRRWRSWTRTFWRSRRRGGAELL